MMNGLTSADLSSVELLIFDCDGVLVDSEWVGVAVVERLLRREGFEITQDEVCDRFVGQTYTDMLATLAQEQGLLVPDGLREEIEASVLEAFETELLPVQGMAEVLASSSLRRCIASSSDLSRIHRSLEITDLSRFFDGSAVFSAEMVSQGKPAPDLFLHAAQTMGVAAERCLVLEDSPHGVRAGVAAGMLTFGFVGARHARPGLADRLREAGCVEVLSHPSQLADLFGNRSLR